MSISTDGFNGFGNRIFGNQSKGDFFEQPCFGKPAKYTGLNFFYVPTFSVSWFWQLVSDVMEEISDTKLNENGGN